MMITRRFTAIAAALAAVAVAFAPSAAADVERAKRAAKAAVVKHFAPKKVQFVSTSCRPHRGSEDRGTCIVKATVARTRWTVTVAITMPVGSAPTRARVVSAKRA